MFTVKNRRVVANTSQNRAPEEKVAKDTMKANPDRTPAVVKAELHTPKAANTLPMAMVTRIAEDHIQKVFL